MLGALVGERPVASMQRVSGVDEVLTATDPKVYGDPVEVWVMTLRLCEASRRGAFAAVTAFAALAASACARPAGHYAVDAAMVSAYRADVAPPHLAGVAPRAPSAGAPSAAAPMAGGAPWAGRYELLAGDLHCHVSPPDHPLEASRGPAETVELARDEGLDFVVLTPHVGARFFAEPAERDAVVDGLARLRREIEGAAGAGGAPGGRATTFIYGLEYTDHQYGHLGLSFADLERVLAAVPAAVARTTPARFFEEYAAQGGLVVIHHPLVTPLDSVFSMARANLSWRPFTAAHEAPFPPEIAAATRLAQGIEAYNLTVTHLRDRYLLGDTDRTLLATLALIDRQILAQGRRIAPVGGSDSHSDHVRTMTFVLSEGRSPAAIREAIAAGRLCVRAPEACSLEVRAAGAGGAWALAGGSLRGVRAVEARAGGGPVQILVNGNVVEEPEPGRAGG